ncbi:hypothetical protein CCZ40_30800, partial [Bacillus thuringiensis]
YCFFLKFYIISYSNFAHRKIPSIVNRLMCFLFTVYYKGIISYQGFFLFLLAALKHQINYY